MSGAGTAGGPRRERRRPVRRALPVLAAAVLAVAALLAAAPAAAQEDGGGAETAEELLVEAPRPYRIAVTGSALLWHEAATRSPDDGSLWGLEVERLLLRWAFARLGAAFGRSTVTSGERSADVNSYLLEVVLGPRVAVADLRELGVIPYAAVGFGSLVHDPRVDGLATRSQNAFSWGAGVEWSFRPDLGVRAEWRQYSADLEDIFAELDRTGQTRDADRFQIAVFWAF